MDDHQENGFVEGLFQLSEAGSTDFYPWGGLWRGFETTGQRQRDELRKVGRLFFQLAIAGWLLLFFAASGPDLLLYGAGLLIAALHVWYHRATQRILVDTAPASAPFPWRRACRKIARSMSRGMLWTFAGICVATILLGASEAVNRGAFSTPGLAIVLVFGVLAACAACLIAIRDRD